MARSKKFFASLLSLTLALISVITLSIPTFAATSSKVTVAMDDYLPIVTYASPLSGASRVYAYSDSSLKIKQSGYYIDTYSDQIVIRDISSDGKSVYVTYPSGSSGKTRSKWFKTDDILGLNKVSVKEYKSASKTTTYRMSSSSKVKSYGSISNGDKCVVFGTHIVNGTTYYVTVYPISRTKVNGVYVNYKIALSTNSGESNKKVNVETNNAKAFQMPLKGNVVITQKYGKSGHLGIDMKSTNDSSVYAFAAGKVVATGLNGTGTDASVTSNPKGNGYYVVIEHTINNKTVYSMYGHLKKGSIEVEVGQNVKAGEKIATIGNTGNSTGTHLHFAIANTKRAGSYYGYTSSQSTFSANSMKESRTGITFYNPDYVIKNGKLP